jgi:hypothetical protein
VRHRIQDGCFASICGNRFPFPVHAFPVGKQVGIEKDAEDAECAEKR